MTSSLKIDERRITLDKAAAEIGLAICEVSTKYDLSSAEITLALTKNIASWAHFSVLDERANKEKQTQD